MLFCKTFEIYKRVRTGTQLDELTGQLAGKENENYTLNNKLKETTAALEKTEEANKSLKSQLDNVTSTLHSKVGSRCLVL